MTLLRFSCYCRCLFLRSLGPLGTVFRTPLLAIIHACGIERAPDDVVTHSRQILDAAAPHEHDRVFLQVMPDSRDVGRDFDAIGQPRPSHLAQRGIGFLGSLRVHANADTALFRASLQRRRLCFRAYFLASVTDQLRKRRHGSPSLELKIRFCSRPAFAGTRSLGVYQQKGSVATPVDRQDSPRTESTAASTAAVKRRGLLGFAGLAPHSGRSPSSVPTSISGAGDLPLLPQGKNSPDKTLSIGKKCRSVKIKTHFFRAKHWRPQPRTRTPANRPRYARRDAKTSAF